MIFGLADLPSEVESLLKELNSFDQIAVNTLDDLQNGLIISQVIASTQSRQNFMKLVSPSSVNMNTRWKLVQDFMKLNYTWPLDEFLPDEIIYDKGVLLVTCKTILKLIGKNITLSHRRSISHFARTVENSQSPQKYQPKNGFSESFSQIFTLYQSQRLIPSSLSIYEFVHKAKLGLSLFEILKKLDLRQNLYKDFCIQPSKLEDCIENLNKLLRHLRLFTKISIRVLYTSDKIYEENQEYILKLLQSMLEYYSDATEKPNKSFSRDFETASRRSNSNLFSSTCKSLDQNLSVFSDSPIRKRNNLKTNEKYEIIDWISALGLLDFLVASENPLKNTLENGVLLCEVIRKLYLHKLDYIKKPRSAKNSLQNFSLALSFFEKIGFKDFKHIELTEDFTFLVLKCVKDSFQPQKGPVNISLYNSTENLILAWLQIGGLISSQVNKLIDIIPSMQTGELLIKIVNCFVKETEKIEISSDSVENISKALQLMQKKPLMSQRYTKNIYEIYRGEEFIIISLLEDLHEYSKRNKKVLKRESSKIQKTSISKFDQKTLKLLESWLLSKGVYLQNLYSEEIKEFKSGEILCEITQKFCGSAVSPICNPKTSAEAIWNIKRSLDFIYSKYDFPIKYLYLDDLISAGNGETIRNLLQDLMKVINI